MSNEFIERLEAIVWNLILEEEYELGSACICPNRGALDICWA